MRQNSRKLYFIQGGILDVLFVLEIDSQGLILTAKEILVLTQFERWTTTLHPALKVDTVF